MNKLLASAAAAFAAGAFSFSAAEEAPPQAPDAVRFRAGADLRLRLEAFDDIPIRTAAPSVTRGGYNNYFRVRTRISGGVDFGDAFSIDARATDEFRVRNHGGKSYEWPDEAVIDQFALSVRGLFDGRVDLRVGRQDAVLGSGRLFAEGTAKDGSRTQYFDGVLARVRLAEKTTLDVFGFYGSCENDLAVGHEHRDVTGLSGGYNDMDEATAGFFFEDRSMPDLGWGLYYVWLRDTAWRTAAGVHVPHEDVHTFGVRLLPRFADEFSGEFEGAFQFSESDGYDRRALFGLASLAWSPFSRTTFSANALHLTGDDPGTGRREDFNILFGRYPWISELLLYGFDGDGVGTWRNLTSLWLEAKVAPADGHSVKFTAGPVFAPERDGAGGGDFRGWLETAFWSFPVCSGRLGALTGHLFLELFEPDDYYVSDATAYFFRAQLNWAF